MEREHNHGGVPSIASELALQMLGEAYDMVFYINPAADMATCLRARESTGMQGIHFILSESLDTWFERLSVPEDTERLHTFFVENLREGMNGPGDTRRIDFKTARSQGDSIRNYACFLTNIGGNEYICFGRDITKEKKYEQLMERNRILYADVDAITFEYSLVTRVLECTFFDPDKGYRELVIRDFLDHMQDYTLFRGDQMKALWEKVEGALKGVEQSGFELLLNPRHNGFRWYRMRWHCLRNERGEVERILGRTWCVQSLVERQQQQLRDGAAVELALVSDALFYGAFDAATGEKIHAFGSDLNEDNMEDVGSLTQLREMATARIHPDDLHGLYDRLLELNFIGLDPARKKKKKYECRLHMDAWGEGVYHWVEISYMHTRSEIRGHEILYIVAMDIEDRKEREQEILEEAITDHTTHFLSREAFEEHCDSERDNTWHARELNALMVVEIIYHHKRPGYGGLRQEDSLIQKFAEIVRLWMGKDDVVSRFGDEKFLICMHGLRDQTTMQERIATLRRAIGDSGIEDENVSVYMGITQCLHDCNTGYRSAFDRAEVALEEAKRNEHSRAVFFSDELTPLLQPEREHEVVIRTFGYFDVFVDQVPVKFSSAKAKELLALLVDRRGGLLSPGEAISYLWEDEPRNQVTLARCRKVAMRMKNTLNEYGIGDIIGETSRKRFLKTDKVQCDLYDYLSGKPEFSKLYGGSYMLNYSWAEVTTAQLNKDIWDY